MPKKTIIGIIQSKISSSYNSNLSITIKNIKKAANRTAKIICLPELFLSAYFCQTESHSNFKLAEKIPGRITKIFSDLAKELGVILCELEAVRLVIGVSALLGSVDTSQVISLGLEVGVSTSITPIQYGLCSVVPLSS